MNNKDILQNHNTKINDNNIIISTLLESINNLPESKPDPVLQDKSIEITENGTTNIVADEGYDGLNSVDVIVNAAEDLTAELTAQNEEITEQEISIDNIIQALQGKVVPEKVNLQDKTIEINDEYVLDITADDGFDGLGVITIIVNSNKYAEYQMLEYIKGTSYVTGSNYFKTGIYPTNKTTIELRYSFYKNDNNYSNLYASSRQFLAQSTTANDTRVVALWNNELIGNMSGFNNFDAHVIKQDKNVMYFDGSLVQTCTNAEWQDENELLLFGCPGGQDASAILYYCKIWEDDILIRDFVPCYRKSDGLIGILDKVERKFYENAGTVPFEKGPNI